MHTGILVNSHKKVKFTMAVKAENIVANTTRVIGKSRATLSMTDLNSLK